MNRYRTLLLAAGVLVLVLVVVIFFFGIKNSDPRFEGELTLWSFEGSDAWKDIIRAFQEEYPQIEIVYEQKNERTYETDLLNALAAGRGPDMFVIHSSWLLKHGDKLAGAPPELLGAAQFRAQFVDVAARDLVGSANEVGAVPLYMDSLALYYNKDIYNAHGIIAPPKTWTEFNGVVQRTTILGTDGAILQAGAALGTQNNVTNADDVVEMFMLQNGAVMTSLDQQRALFTETRSGQDGSAFSPGENALQYYTNFADPARTVYTWSRRMGDARTTFLNGEAAMYIGYAQDLEDIRESGIPFEVAPIPQVRDRSVEPSYIDSTLARYWAGAVSFASPKQTAAWAFWTFATSRNAQYNFLTKTNLPTSRRDLVEVQVERDTQMGVFARQSLIAKGWFQPDYQAVSLIFKEMIENVVLGRSSVQDAVSDAEDGVTELFKTPR